MCNTIYAVKKKFTVYKRKQRMYFGSTCAPLMVSANIDRCLKILKGTAY